MRPHPDFCAATRWQCQVRGVNGRHEIAENIPQRSRAPVTFRWARVQINNVPEMAADRATL
jgi:hypothetical protein